MSQPDVAKMRPKSQHSRIPVRQVRRRDLDQITSFQVCPGSKATSEPTSMVPNASASDLVARASMLGSARSVGIGHSQLNAAGRDHYNITNNYNCLPADDRDLQEKYRSGQRKAEKRTANDENAQTPKNTAKQEKMKEEPSEGNINGAIWRSQTPEQCAIYVQNLLRKGHGWPIYVPGPNKRLPKMYRRKGMQIGDVGIFNKRGSFEFFFNICHPANHRINCQGVPKNFKQLRIQPTDIQEHSEFNGESYIASSSIKNSSGLKFESSASEGAILAMPVGAISEDVRNEAIFRKYTSIHAEDWYRYINNIRGRDAKNGDVRLVIGYHKTSHWCIATFADATAKQNPFFLEFNPLTETNIGKMYEWKHSGTAEVRSGPGDHEIEDLRKGDPDHERTTYQNQSLFGRTISATLGEDIWNKLAAESVELETDDDSTDNAPESSNQGSIGSKRTNSSTSSTFTSANVPGQRTALATINNISIDPAMRFASVSHHETTMPDHPSDAINKMLLKLNPNARVAITSDNDWISVLRKDDFTFPSTEQLCSRIKASLVIRQDKDVVFLEKPESPTSSLCIENDTEDGSSTIERSTSRMNSVDVMPTRWGEVTPILESAAVSTPEISSLTQASQYRSVSTGMFPMPLYYYGASFITESPDPNELSWERDPMRVYGLDEGSTAPSTLNGRPLKHQPLTHSDRQHSPTKTNFHVSPWKFGKQFPNFSVRPLPAQTSSTPGGLNGRAQDRFAFNHHPSITHSDRLHPSDNYAPPLSTQFKGMREVAEEINPENEDFLGWFRSPSDVRSPSSIRPYFTGGNSRRYPAPPTHSRRNTVTYGRTGSGKSTFIDKVCGLDGDVISAARRFDTQPLPHLGRLPSFSSSSSVSAPIHQRIFLVKSRDMTFSRHRHEPNGPPYSDSNPFGYLPTLLLHRCIPCRTSELPVGNLAYTYPNQGSWNEAELPSRLGADHPSTLTRMAEFQSNTEHPDTFISMERICLVQNIYQLEAVAVSLSPWASGGLRLYGILPAREGNTLVVVWEEDTGKDSEAEF